MDKKRYNLLLVMLGIGALLLVVAFKLPVEGALLGVVVAAFCLWKNNSRILLIPTIASVIAIAAGLGIFLKMASGSLEQGTPTADYWLLNLIFG